MQGRSALAIQGQGAHQGALGCFVPRFQRHLLARINLGLLVVAARLELCDQAAERRDHQLFNLLAAQQHPLFKRRCIDNRKTLQETAAVERDSCLQILDGCVGRVAAPGWPGSWSEPWR
jgi:hypothetical protein